MFKALLRSVGIILVISSIIGSGTYFFGSFWGGFIISTIVQLLGGYLWSIILERKDKMFKDALLTELSEAPTPFDLTCAYCNTQNRVPMFLSRENVFACKHCNQTNKVYMQFTTVRLTTPLVKNEALNEVPILEEDNPTIRQTTVNQPLQFSGK